jgi:endoglucanase
VALLLLSVLIASPLKAEGMNAFVQAHRLGRGVNVLGWDPMWKDPAAARFKPRLFKVIRDGGFQTIRVNLYAFDHMNSADWLDPRWLYTLDAVVKQATAAGLNVILDEHDYERFGVDPDACRPKLLAFWEQIGSRYRNAPRSVLFEILNEPNGELTPDRWNALLAEALAVIRRSNPTRTVVIGPASYNTYPALGDLQLPEKDHNIIVTVHYYNPLRFTHQGAAWASPEIQAGINIHWGSEADRAVVDQDFDAIAAWGKAHHRPISVGEFGAYDAAPLPDRVAWTSAVARAAEKRGLPWVYWQFEVNFSAYDIAKDRWIEPIYHALIPTKAR